ncbi:hypothetical protein ACFPT7_17530 [Acidicapsa dinghuensis]|uniref:Uncharacterized protein n=1 Tax=Acidicapsa dinghuensis TaxID=2218256 RepID=A0ABW1EII3_9BACT|nr:hypothetical protein [Acidicapsa dinghuensis]
MAIQQNILKIPKLLFIVCPLLFSLSPKIIAQIAVQHDTLSSTEKKQANRVANDIAKKLREMQRTAGSHVMSRWPASKRNMRLACTLAYTGKLNEREGNAIGVISFESLDPTNDPALKQLVSFAQYQLEGEYGFHHFDVAVWPVRRSTIVGYAVRIEMRQGLYYDWADSHITDDSLGKNWWRSLVVPECQ